MNKSTIILLCFILIGSCLWVYSLMNETEEADIYFTNETIYAMESTWVEPDYSSEGYMKATLGNLTKFIMFECIDGELEITKTTISCIEPKGDSQ